MSPSNDDRSVDARVRHRDKTLGDKSGPVENDVNHTSTESDGVPRITDFGYESVFREEKSGRVREVFDSVAPRYDLMNDLMSVGLHRVWKKFALQLSGVRSGQRVLDLAGGTGDLASLMARRFHTEGYVVLADINAAMLERGRDKLLDQGLGAAVNYMQCDAERLPIGDSCFDCVIIGFGLRNVTDKQCALKEMYRVLRPGGRVLVLEFSKVRNPVLRKLYDLYSFSVLPKLGQLVAKDEASYKYLAESIRMHPDQETLCAMMAEVGFARCEWFNFAAGVVALHRGYKL